MSVETDIKQLLYKKFPQLHVNAALKHLFDATKKYQKSDWEVSTLKIGKFVEAALKMIYVHCGQILPPSRRFSVASIVINLGKLSGFSDTLRLLIPRACVFIYDIASNRGARHDPDEINPNKMDASIALSTASWILAELLRFSDSASSTPESTIDLVEGLVEKKYPYFENIDGRTYINFRNLSPRDAALLILNVNYPKRMSREDLKSHLERHDYDNKQISNALTRLKGLIDDENGWKLRGLGREEADRILTELQPD